MLRTGVDVELAENLCAETVLRKHALDRVFNDTDREAIEHLAGRCEGRAALIARVTEVGLVRQLLSRELYLLSIDDDDVVAGINMRRVDGLVLAAQNFRDLRCKTADRLVLCIYDLPLALNIGCFCHNRGFHVIPP